MISIPISVGELIDKLSILRVKSLKIKNPEKLSFVNKEFELLYNLSSEFLNNSEIESLYHKLVDINSFLWEIEDRIRELEYENKFDDEFIQVARKVYITNDKRFQVKNEINLLTSSEIQEVKDYKEYTK